MEGPHLLLSYITPNYTVFHLIKTDQLLGCKTFFCVSKDGIYRNTAGTGCSRRGGGSLILSGNRACKLINYNNEKYSGNSRDPLGSFHYLDFPRKVIVLY